MSAALVASVVVLWIAVLSLALVVLALVRQVGVLHERLAPAGALALGRGPRVGETAPKLRVESLTGPALELGGESPDGRATLLLFVSPTCPVCKTLLPALRSLAQRERASLRLVLASDGPRAAHEAFVRERELARFPYVLSAELGRAHGVAQLPYAVLIDAQGVIRARGLVNQREHLESLLEAQALGVGSLSEYLASPRAS